MKIQELRMRGRLNARSPARDDGARSGIRPLFKKSPVLDTTASIVNKLLNRLIKEVAALSRIK